MLVLLLCPGALHARPVELPPGADRLTLTPHLHYRQDSESAGRMQDAFVHVREGRFKPVPGGNAAFGFQRGAFWFHATVVNRNQDEQRWLLVQEYPLSDRLDVWVRHADGRILHQAGGDHLPFDVRSVRYRHPNFRLDLPPDEPVDLLVRVESESSMQVPLELYTPAAFTELSRDAQLAIGLYYGILLALFFYNLVLWISLRDPSYFWYLFHITAFGLVLFTLNGLGFEYLWPNWPWLADRSVPLSICLALIGMNQFTRTFLELPQRWPAGNVASLTVIGFFVFFGIASLWLPYRIATPIASLAVLVGIAWIVAATVRVVRLGYRPAQLLLLAWGMFLLGTAVFTLLAFGVLPKNFFTEYGVQIGSALEMLLLSIALGYRYASLRNENERIAGEANVMLERKVAQRTQEVRNALMQLEEAHGRLRESSRRDGLTGLYNRTWFHEAFDRMVADSRQSRRPVSLLIVDLDHFKAINDRHGHLVGDEALRWAARRIDSAMDEHALLARFGGEEFVIALPGHDLSAAVAVAEAVRQALVSEPCLAHDHEIRISASIGVHTINADDIDAVDDALEVADRAMYAAKANGRNCVRTSISAA
ncbi:diguanylate cyclase [Luteimonas dalianensis]|uniref:diguanylate cyclase n=1 Tax=Luteimonas dalianensis TaxID=1148196 RepID=UPI003BF0A149